MSKEHKQTIHKAKLTGKQIQKEINKVGMAYHFYLKN